MQTYTIYTQDGGFRRVCKDLAFRRYLNGEPIYVLPHRLRPSAWTDFILVPNGVYHTAAELEKAVNQITYYNCSYATGYYLAYYIKQ